MLRCLITALLLVTAFQGVQASPMFCWDEVPDADYYWIYWTEDLSDCWQRTQIFTTCLDGECCVTWADPPGTLVFYSVTADHDYAPESGDAPEPCP